MIGAKTERTDYRTDAIVRPTTTYTSAKHETMILGTTAGGAFTLTLPHCSEMAGKKVTIAVTAVSGAMTVVFTGDMAARANLTSLDAALDRIVIYSDGLFWHTVSSTIA